MEISPGKGSSIGGPPTPSQEETERTGGTRSAMISLGIMTASQFDSQSIADIGKKDTWKYQSDATKPTIPPLRNLPVMAKAWVDRDKEWMSEFNKLLNLLPEDIRQRYLEESKLPPDERSAEYGDLDSLLGFIADMTRWIHKVATPGEVAEASKMQMEMDKMFADHMRQSMVHIGKELVSSAFHVLEAIGRNDIHFDALSLQLRQIDAALNELASGEEGEALSPLVKDLQGWSVTLESRNMGDQLKILHALSAILGIITAGSSIESGSASALLGLGVANVGIDGTSSEIGILPEKLVLLREVLIDQLQEVLPLANNGSLALLTSIVSALILSSITLGSCSDQMQSPLLFNLTAQFVVTSNLLTAFCSSIATSCGADENTKGVASDLIAFTAIALLLNAAHSSDKEKALDLITSIKTPLLSLLNNIESVLSQETSGMGAKMAILAQSGIIALDSEDFEGFLAIAEEFGNLEPLEHETQVEQLKEMKENLKEFIALIRRQAFDMKEEDKTHPNIGVFLG